MVVLFSRSIGYNQRVGRSYNNWEKAETHQQWPWRPLSATSPSWSSCPLYTITHTPQLSSHPTVVRPDGRRRLDWVLTRPTVLPTSAHNYPQTTRARIPERLLPTSRPVFITNFFKTPLSLINLSIFLLTLAIPADCKDQYSNWNCWFMMFLYYKNLH